MPQPHVRPGCLSLREFGSADATSSTLPVATSDAVAGSTDNSLRVQQMFRALNGCCFSPFEVEEVLLHHPALLDVLAFAIPRPDGSDAVGVAVVLRPGADSVDALELCSFARGQLAAAFLPIEVLVLSSLPHGTVSASVRARLAATLLPGIEGESRRRPSLAECEALVFEELAAMGIGGERGVQARWVPFCELGVDSLGSVQLVQRLNSRMVSSGRMMDGLHLRETAVFEYPSVAQLAAAMRAELGGALDANAVSNDQSRRQLATVARGNAPTNQTPRRARIPTAQRALTSNAVRAPGAIRCVSDLFRLIASGGDAITPIPWLRHTALLLFAHDDATPLATRHGGFVHGAELFDNVAFGVSRIEARATDPQQLLLLELGYEATHSAGMRRASLLGSQLSVVVGIMNADFGHLAAGVHSHPCA